MNDTITNRLVSLLKEVNHNLRPDADIRILKRLTVLSLIIEKEFKFINNLEKVIKDNQK